MGRAYDQAWTTVIQERAASFWIQHSDGSSKPCDHKQQWHWQSKQVTIDVQQTVQPTQKPVSSCILPKKNEGERELQWRQRPSLPKPGLHRPMDYRLTGECGLTLHQNVGHWNIVRKLEEDEWLKITWKNNRKPERLRIKTWIMKLDFVGQEYIGLMKEK